MALRWSKRRVPLACPSGAECHGCGSCLEYDPCSDGCPKNDVQHITLASSQDKNPRFVHLERREQVSEDAPTSTSSSRTATGSVVATLTPITSSSPSTTARSAPSNRPNTAVIVGASAGGFVFLLLVGIIIFFWLHTQKSRRHHHSTFERRLSDPSNTRVMAQKQLLRLSIVDQAAPAHARTASHIYISPTTTTERRASQHASRNIGADPVTYRHYSAEDFRLPESPATVLDAWKTSHRPTTWDLTRRSIGTFELDSPLSPEEYSAATSRKSSVVSSLGSGSRKSSLKGGVFSVSQTLPVPPLPPVPPPPAALGAWDTHRRSTSTGAL